MGIGPEHEHFRQGIEQASNPSLWRSAISLQRERLCKALASEDADYGVDIEGTFLLVSVCNGVRIAKSLDSSPRLKNALSKFEEDFPDVINLRNVYTHLDEYISNQGRLQRNETLQPGGSSWRTREDGDVVFRFAHLKVKMVALGDAAIELMTLAEDEWRRQAVMELDTTN